MITVRKIVNQELSLTDIPKSNADWDEIGEFALTFDGYEFWGSDEKYAEIVKNRYTNTLAELRTCLFCEQRKWRFWGYEPDDEAMIYIRSLVEKIRNKVESHNFE